MGRSVHICIALAPLLAGCGMLRGPACHEVLDTVVDRPAALVAWTLADAARRSLPDADPLPAHRGAPVVRGAGTFTIEYRGASHHGAPGLRVAMNGRLLPPGFATDGTGRLDEPRFVQMAPTAAGPAARAILITVRALGDSRCAVHLTIRGEAAVRPVADHAFAALDALAPDADRVCCKAHALLHAHRHVDRATRHADAGDIVLARMELEHARHGAPTDRHLVKRRAQVEDRLAEHFDACSSWDRFVAAETGGDSLDRFQLAIALHAATFAEQPPMESVVLARHAARLGMTNLGLRLLARSWPRIENTEAEPAATAVFDKLALAAGPEMTCRVVVAERTEGRLTARAMRLWQPHATRRESALALFDRKPTLRTRAFDPVDTEARLAVPPSPHYAGAPGVAAPPR